jgi:hypothetical protein
MAEGPKDINQTARATGQSTSEKVTRAQPGGKARGKSLTVKKAATGRWGKIQPGMLKRALFIALATLASLGCQSRTIVGSWKGEYMGETHTFKPDGTFIVQSVPKFGSGAYYLEEGRYRVHDGMLTLSQVTKKWIGDPHLPETKKQPDASLRFTFDGDDIRFGDGGKLLAITSK